MTVKNYFPIFLFSLIISFCLTHIVRHLGDRYKITKRNGEPSRLGGLAFYTVFCLVLLLNQNFKIAPLETNFFNTIMVSSGLIFVFGLVDDFKELPITIKLIAQTLIASILPFFDIRFRFDYLPVFLNTILTILWIVTIINAFNLLDILDGLAAGIALISGLTFCLLSFYALNPEIGFISVVVCAAIIPFFILNIKPAKIFMGDSGSMFLGFIFAVIAIRITYTHFNRYLAYLTPILVLGLPIYDITFVCLLRIIKGKSPLLKSRDHFSLRLISLGYGHKQAILFMYVFCAFFCLLAILSSTLSDLYALAVLIFVVPLIFLLSRRVALAKI